MKGNAAIILAALIVAAVLAGPQLFSAIGFSTLSLSKVDYVSNDVDVGGEAWSMLISLSGAGESAQGTFAASQIQDPGDNVKATTDFTLKTMIAENKIEYTIQNDFDKLKTADYRKLSCGILGCTDASGKNADALKACTSFGGFRTIKPSFSFDTYCLFAWDAGTKGIVRDDFKRIFAAEISTTKSGIETKTTVNSVDQSSARIGDFGFVRWEGFLSTDVNEPTPTGQDVCALYENGWKTIDCSDFQTWQSSFQQWETGSCLSDVASLENCKQRVNNFASVVKQGKQFTALGGTGQVSTGVTNGGLDSGKVVIDLPRQYTTPLLTVKLKTSYIGKIAINVPVGKPDIILVSSDEFQSAATTKGFIKAQVKNVGESSAAFDVSAVCKSPFSSNDRIRVNLDPNEVDTVLLTITAAVAQPTTDSCTVKAEDVNNPSNFDTEQVIVKATNIQVCEPGKKKTEGRFILKCNQFGSGFDIIEECEEDEVADPLTMSCVDKIVEKPVIGDIGGLFKGAGDWVVTVLVLLIILFFVFKSK